MFKLIGVISVISSFVFWGLSKSMRLKQRTDSLSLFINMLDWLRTEIEMKQTHLSDAFELIGTKCQNKCFLMCAEDIDKMGGQDSFSNAVINTKELYCFLDEDINIFLEFSINLGMVDLYNQVRRIDETISKLKKSLSEAQTTYTQNSKMYVSISVLAGIFVVLIVL